MVLLMPALRSGLSVKAKPPQKEATLNIIKFCAARNPNVTGYALVTLVSPIADLTCDIKKQGKAADVVCMTTTCDRTGNKNLEPFLPFVVEAAQSNKQTHGSVEKHAGRIFVQDVETPALAATLPVLCCGLNDKSEEVRCTCFLVVGNMCKLVEDPAEVLPLLSRLEPLVKSGTVEIADPEVRGAAEKAYKTLQKAAGDGNAAENKVLEAKVALAIFKTALGDKDSGEDFDTVGLHFAGLAAAATNMRQFDAAMWKSELGLGPFASGTEDIRVKMEVTPNPVEEIEEVDTEGVDLYKGSSSLAYGTLTLLRDTKMHLGATGSKVGWGQTGAVRLL